MDLSITPDDYKKLWWEGLVDAMSIKQRCFTIPDLYELAEATTGQSLSYSNFHRSVLKNAPIFKTGILKTETLGRPAMYYCSMKY